MEKKILSISLLVSNRISTIEKCMESLQPILSAVPSELIAVDTGSTDGSIDIVKKYADKIVSFEWCNDFAAARNAGLKEAEGEWFMYIDDDEWFEDASEIVDFFNSGEYKNYGRALYIIRDYKKKDGSEYSDGYVGRMSKITDELEFKGIIHEGMYPVYEPCKSFKSYAHHYGYAFENEEERKKHSERNISLLLKATEKNKDFRLKAQLLQEYRADRNYEAAEKLCEEAFCAYETDKKHPFIQWMLATWIRLYTVKEEWRQAVLKAEELCEKVEFNVPSKMILAANAMSAAYNCGRSEAGIKWAEEYIKAAGEINANPDKYGSIMIFDALKFLNEEDIEKAEALKEYLEGCRTPVLSISVLVSNSIGTIEKCMKSLETLRRTVPSELIVVDTGGTDGSIEVAKGYADKVIRFEWCHDFAAARNAGLKEASGEWFMFLDDDEWFEDTTAISEFFTSGEYKNYGRASYFVRNYEDLTGTKYGEYYIARMSKRTDELSFKGRVHEWLEPIYDGTKYLPCFAHHYGYAHVDEKSLKKRIDRNVSLILEEIKERPNNFRMYAQLLQEYKAVGDVEKAVGVCKKVSDIYKGMDKTEPFAEWIIASWVRMYEAGMCGEALKTAEYIEKQHRLGMVASMLHSAACFVAAQRALKYDSAIEYAEKYLRAADEVLKLQNPDSVLLADSRDFVSDGYRRQVTTGLMVACLETGDVSKYEEYKALTGGHYEEIFNHIFANGRNLSCFWQTLELDIFKLLIAKAVKEKGRETVKEQLNSIKESISEVRQEFAYYADMLLLEEELLHEYETSKSVDKEHLYRYARSVVKYHSCIYSDKQFEENKLNNLPRVCRFAILVGEGRKYAEAKNTVEELRAYKKAAQVYPLMLPLMTNIIENYNKDKEEAVSANFELKLLAVQLKRQIELLIKADKKAEALAIIEELKQMLPEDVELDELKDRITMS